MGSLRLVLSRQAAGHQQRYSHRRGGETGPTLFPHGILPLSSCPMPDDIQSLLN
jgi:hypothetical protein